MPSSSFKRRQPGQAKAQAQQRSVISGSDVAAAVDISASAESAASSAAAAQSFVPRGLRPSPFPSPVPLFSTGLASLDDLISGHGVPSSSVIAFCPAVGLTSISAEAGFGGGVTASEQDAHAVAAAHPQSSHLRRKMQTTSRVTIEALQAAEQTLIDLLAYGIAQGLVSSHRVVVMGQNSRELIEKRVPARATLRDASTSDRKHRTQDTADAVTTGTIDDHAATDHQQDVDDAMTIAFRYAHRPKFRTTVNEPSVIHDTDDIPPEHRFRAPFDMAKRLSLQHIEELEAKPEVGGGGLRIVETTKYDEVMSILEQEAKSCISIADDRRCQAGAIAISEPRPLRIHLVSLGSSAWSRASDSMDRRIAQLSRFLLRLRRLIKHLVLEREQNGKQALHVICTVSLSPALLTPPWRTLVTQHLLRFFDVQVLLSDFSQDEQLRKAYGGYGGSVCLLKGPSIASILPHGEHRSVLRGGGGDAGVENDVGWRRRKRGKGIVLETLHEDVDAVTTSQENTAGGSTNAEGAKRSGTGLGGGDDIEDSAVGMARRHAKTSPSTARSAMRGFDDDDRTGPHRHFVTHTTLTPASGSSNARPPPEQLETLTNPSAARGTAPTAAVTPRFQGGLKSLRERGLRAAATKQIEVQMEKEQDPKGRPDIAAARTVI